ncbi:hypothetical protein J2Y45_001823 [Dyadobacter sp. BE34]|jgi:hypothetical protein|uniref:Uncharacterized protein n=1 Tax=Dyadobacter fermentans TaxID=94254 RepID=A0ABU1QTT2_9BACT|nr:hypothetical protein [Dyadobacter fermentans]MDR7042294.1 hypothetical protein [Dyadobacter sp. BE242]MDR7196697.1 hypothetical protein [Dyadobacter sp. BE34]MDR7212758.1 hypothetical protein [Dyadobacter sp. BE31]MDR7262103.1 hypothetical protein [Dyadobacter sp. BE32]
MMSLSDLSIPFQLAAIGIFMVTCLLFGLALINQFERGSRPSWDRFGPSAVVLVISISLLGTLNRFVYKL